MKTSSRLLWSAVAMTMSIGLTACGGDKTAEPVEEKTEAEAPKTEAETKEEAPKAEGDGEVIKVATEGAYPPLNFTTADGKLDGFDIDVTNALCEQMKAKCEIIAQDWEGIIPGLQAKKYDAIIAGMAITDERKQAVDFTDPYFSSGLLLVAKADSDITLESLEGKTVGAQKATIAAGYLEEKKLKAEIKLYDTQENASMDLVNGRLDAFMADQVVATAWLDSDDAKGYEQKGTSISTGADDFGIAVRKGDALAGKFNTALAEIKANGTYETISQKYFDKAAK